MSDFAPGALAGLTVVDLSRVLAGPSCTQILGDHGANVIKVEPPQGDETRGWGPPFSGDTAAYFLGLNRNKRDIALDFSTQEGRDVLHRLLETADVLVENFKPGSLEAWGIGDPEAIGARYPRLVHCRISGFGSDGPLGGLPGYDAVAQAMTGLMSINGEAERGPLRVGIPVVDLATGLNAVIGILLALTERARSGRGQFVETTLFDSGMALMHPHLANYQLSKRAPGRSGNAHPNITPYDSFRTSTVEVFLAVGNDRQFRKLCDALGRPELARDPRFESNRARNTHRDELRRELETLLGTRDGRTLGAELMALGVPCGPVLDVEQVLNLPHAQHRDMVIEIGEYRGTGSPVKLSRTPATYRTPPPGFNEHAAEIMEQIAAPDEA